MNAAFDIDELSDRDSSSEENSEKEEENEDKDTVPESKGNKLIDAVDNKVSNTLKSSGKG